MMGIGPVEAATLSMWDYEATLWHWNDRHADPAAEKVDLPSEEFVRHRQMLLAERGLGVAVH